MGIRKCVGVGDSWSKRWERRWMWGQAKAAAGQHTHPMKHVLTWQLTHSLPRAYARITQSERTGLSNCGANGMTWWVSQEEGLLWRVHTLSRLQNLPFWMNNEWSRLIMYINALMDSCVPFYTCTFLYKLYTL